LRKTVVGSAKANEEEDDSPVLPKVQVQTKNQRIDPDAYVPSQNEIMDVLSQYLPDFDYERVMRQAETSLEVELDTKDFVQFRTDKRVASQDRVYHQLMDLCTPHGLTPLLSETDKLPFFQQYVALTRERNNGGGRRPTPPPVVSSPPQSKRPRNDNEPSHWINPVPDHLSTAEEAFWDVRNWMTAASGVAESPAPMNLT
jgi:hypothetical protein